MYIVNELQLYFMIMTRARRLHINCKYILNAEDTRELEKI